MYKHDDYILFDMDGVIFDLLTPWLDWINNDYDIQSRLFMDGRRVNGESLNFKPEHVTQWDVAKSLGLTNEEAYRFFKNPFMYRSIKPIEGAIESLEYLCEAGLPLKICTAGIEHVQPRIEKIKEYMPWWPVRDIVFTKDKASVRGRVLIDDKIQNLLDFDSVNGVSICYDQPYNQDYKGLRVKNWKLLTYRLLMLYEKYNLADIFFKNNLM